MTGRLWIATRRVGHSRQTLGLYGQFGERISHSKPWDLSHFGPHEIVDDCLTEGIIQHEMHAKRGTSTSFGIQRRCLDTTSKRLTAIDPKFLLTVENPAGEEFPERALKFSERTGVFWSRSTQRKGKKSTCVHNDEKNQD